MTTAPTLSLELAKAHIDQLLMSEPDSALEFVERIYPSLTDEQASELEAWFRERGSEYKAEAARQNRIAAACDYVSNEMRPGEVFRDVAPRLPAWVIDGLNEMAEDSGREPFHV